MKRKASIGFILLCAAAVGLSSCATHPTEKEDCLQALETLPNNSDFALRYRCKNMVKCVNTLRHAGKAQALAALNEYTQRHPFVVEPQTDTKLQWVCRLLFVNPNGWPKMGMGATVPETVDYIARQYSLFPIAMSDGVPFILYNGYHFDGFTTLNGKNDVALCASYSLISHDLPIGNYKAAADLLVNSELFQKLYKDSNEREMMREEILNQAD